MRARSPGGRVLDPAPSLVRIAVRSEPWLPWRILCDGAGRPYEYPRLEAVWEGTLLCQGGLWDVRLLGDCGEVLEEYWAVSDLLGAGFRVERCKP